MQSVVKRLLQDKEDGLIGTNGIVPENARMLRYPIKYIVNGEYIEGFLQDAVEHKEDNFRQLQMVVLRKDMSTIDWLGIVCRVEDSRCVVDWDEVSCAQKMEFATEREKLNLDEKF